MNRKQKIIVSVTGIFLVLLILVGLTYAYFLTRIVGNTNDKSISVTTANLELVYGDGTTELLTSNTKLVPSSNPINTKDFTVTNNGDDTTYVVMIENIRVKNAVTEEPTMFESNDFKYTLTCIKNDGTSCNGVSEQTKLPMSDAILVENDIVSGDTHTYVITLWYLDNGNDQSSDMNKTLEARINIEDPNRINPYSSNTNSLAYNIINNALNVSEESTNEGYALYRTIPLTTPGKESTHKYIVTDTASYETFDMTNYGERYYVYCDEIKMNYYTGEYEMINPQVIKYADGFNQLKDKYVTYYYGYQMEDAAIADATEGKMFQAIFKVGALSDLKSIYYKPITRKKESFEKTLSITPDDYTAITGNQSYYYRGNVKNNYVEFNNMCWRIVRLEGDGSIKLILAKQDLCSNIVAEDYNSSIIGGGFYGDYNTWLTEKVSSDISEMTIKDKFNTFLFGGSFISYDFSMNEETKSYVPWDSNALSKIKSQPICMGNLSLKYDEEGKEIENGYYNENYKRLTIDKTASLICDGTKSVSLKVYPLTADETIFAGEKERQGTRTSYLSDNANGHWTTITPSNSSEYEIYHFENSLTSLVALDPYDFLPAISLISGIELASDSGNGTKTNPYKVKIN